MVNDVLIVNEELVFRFARDDAGRPALEREAFIPGVPLDRQRLLRQDAPARRRILEELGGFLRELHGLPAGAAGATTGPATSLGTRQGYEQLYEAAERELLPQMMAWARDWARELFRPMFDGDLPLTFAPAIIHGDLAPYHLCFDPATQRLSGVIDFGSAGVGDRALDLGSIIAGLGEPLLWEMETVYPEMSAFMDRARFHAATLELRWALAALRSRDPAWFLCHLGYARDAWPVGWPAKRT